MEINFLLLNTVINSQKKNDFNTFIIKYFYIYGNGEKNILLRVLLLFGWLKRSYKRRVLFVKKFVIINYEWNR